MKQCITCDITKEESSFEFRKDSGKLRGKCRDCRLIEKQSHYKNNRSKIIAKAIQYTKDNEERVKAWRRRYYEENKIKIAAQKSEYKRVNRAKFNAAAAKRKATKIQATPLWANLEAIEKFYTTAQGLSMLLGEWYHVDHIVPLQSDFVCGLHCEANLRVILASENLSKSNRYWPDMPDEFAPIITEEQ